jgi:hypothetical protein
MDHDASTLRDLLVRLVASPPATQQEAIALWESFKDCRLELIRTGMPMSADQSHRLRQMAYRVEMVATRHAVPESIPGEARLTLRAFGWGDRI